MIAIRRAWVTVGRKRARLWHGRVADRRDGKTRPEGASQPPPQVHHHVRELRCRAEDWRRRQRYTAGGSEARRVPIRSQEFAGSRLIDERKTTAAEPG